MKKLFWSFMAVAFISTTANAALFKSDSRLTRVFSCTDYCTGTIKEQVFNSRPLTACEVLTMCKAPANKCLESGGLLSRVKGRMSKVKEAMENAESRGVCAKGPGAISQVAPGKTALAPSLSNEDPVVILSIDGGGVRGIVPAVMVVELEKSLQGKKISEVVDLFAGTSAGAILVTLLNIPETPNLPTGKRTAKYTAENALDLCDETLAKIFDTKGPRKYRVLWGLRGSMYSTKPLIKAVQDEVGISLKMNQLVKPAILTAVDLGTHEPFYFNSYGKSSTYAAWEGVMASTAAPIFFKGYPFVMPDGKVIKLTDGGLVSNSPQQEALLAAKKLYPNRDYFLVSLSTGGVVEKANVDVAGAKAGSAPKMIVKTIETTLDTQTFKSSKLLKTLAKDPAQRLEFHRIDVSLPKECSSTDDASDKNVKCLKDSADKVTKSPEFQNMVKRLQEVTGVISSEPLRPRRTAESSQGAAQKAAAKEGVARK